MHESKVFHFLVTLSFPSSIGGEIGAFYLVKEFQHTAKGVIRSRPHETMQQVSNDVLSRARKEAWETYRSKNDFDDRLPEEDVLEEPIVLCFHLVPNEI